MADNPLDEISRGIQNFSDFDSRGIGMTATTEKGGTLKLLEIPTPAWFPDSYLRSLKRNLYYNMINNASYDGKASIGDANNGKCLDFYRDTSGDGILGNMLNTAVKSVVSVAANQIMSVTSKVDSVVNGVSSLASSLFSSNTNSKSLLRMINETAQNPFLASQPYIKVSGIHLAEKVRENWNIIQSVLKGVSSMLAQFKNLATGNLKEMSDYWKEKEDALNNALIKAGIYGDGLGGGSLSDTISKHLMSSEYRMHGFSEAQMIASVAGTYAMTCKLPFFGNNMGIVESSGEGAFRTGFGLGKDDLGIVDLVRKGFANVSWSNPIEWIPEEMGKKNFVPVNYTFNIYNDTLEHLMTNLVFIWSFGATTQCVTDVFSIRPPYLYDIEVPGGFRYRYCNCHFCVTPKGKLRKTSSMQMDFDGEGSGDVICKLFKKLYGFDVNPKAIAYVPDYYEVQVVFGSLLPNMWNFIDSYLHYGPSVPQVGEEVRTMLRKFVDDFKV